VVHSEQHRSGGFVTGGGLLDERASGPPVGAENGTHQVTGTYSCATLPGRSRRSGRIAALDRGEWGQPAAEGGDVADAKVAEASAAIARLVKS
jgi:hypothetical protein